MSSNVLMYVYLYLTVGGGQEGGQEGDEEEELRVEQMELHSDIHLYSV